MPTTTLINDPIPSGNTGVIQAFFATAIDLLFQHSPSHPSLPSEIRVRFGIEGPQVRYGGNSVAGYDFDLTAPNDDWCRHVYQFAHETCHVLAQFQQWQHPNQWFEEAVCEAASLYALETMSSLGTEGQGPCVNLFYEHPPRPFHEAMQHYVDTLIAEPERQFDGVCLAQWLNQNEASLRQNPYQRELTNIVANKLLGFFAATPTYWTAVEFLNAKPCSAGRDSLRDYLDNWRVATPAQHHKLIDHATQLLFVTSRLRSLWLSLRRLFRCLFLQARRTFSPLEN
jgi:hypothetical protein